ncbi:hypothetical protein TcWFU_005014 [Taenia crassiceps]|uniref:Uncharacterized protein n=1 Tax=Taenia crassiceps TaxID=6207 RepID=A0ABR4Q9H6_9CEST
MSLKSSLWARIGQFKKSFGLACPTSMQAVATSNATCLTLTTAWISVAVALILLDSSSKWQGYGSVQS